MNKKKAFSLLELSLVILVVAALVAGIMKGQYLMKEVQIEMAQKITLSSPVLAIEDLEIWYETTLKQSFLEEENEDNSQISSWNDLAGSINPSANNATQSTSSYQPKYKQDFFGPGIAGVQFDGSDDYLDFNGNFVIGSDYTIFIVENRTTNSNTHNLIITGTGQSAGNTLNHGYNSNTGFHISHYDNDLYHANSNYSQETTYIHTLIFSQSNGRSYHLNGSDSPKETSSSTTPLSSYNGANIGGNGPPTNYTGHLGEIIIFSRALGTSERVAIEKYLSKKYKIALE